MNIEKVIKLLKKDVKAFNRWVRLYNVKKLDLSSANLRYANLRYADLRDANLRYADLRDANLRDANLRYVNLRYADLSSANLSSADLRDADLSSANLSSADLSGANLSGANLSGAKDLLQIIDFIKNTFETTDKGIVCYKTFGGQYNPNKNWKIEKGSIINEVVNHNRVDGCGCGINVAPIEWVRKNYKGEIWKCLIRWEWLCGVCVPYHTDGKIRAERVELVEIVEDN